MANRHASMPGMDHQGVPRTSRESQDAVAKTAHHPQQIITSHSGGPRAGGTRIRQEMGPQRRTAGQEGSHLHRQGKKSQTGLHPSVQKVSATKRTKFMEELLQHIEYKKPYADTTISSCIREGFPLVGTMPETGVFQKKPGDEIEFGADPEWLEHLAPDLTQ